MEQQTAMGLADQVCAVPDCDPASTSDLLEADPQIHRVPISSLLPADSPRLNGEDISHTRMMAESDAKLPPIIVHRASMRVIDGMHRLGAAKLRGEETIEVRFFDGSVQEAFVLGVKANVTHGRPLSDPDRTTAAERIVESHPMWSDRAIAAATGLGARKISSIRRRIRAEADNRQEPKARKGRDGRIRPIDNTEGRLRASEIIRDRPNASLREIAKAAGVSPTTALDVRNRLQRGDDPLPATKVSHQVNGRDMPTGRPNGNRRISQQKISAMLDGLRTDPSLRFTESGRALLRWIQSRVIQPGEWRDVSDQVPTHTTYIMAVVARRCADEWLRVAEDLERRAQQVA